MAAATAIRVDQNGTATAAPVFRCDSTPLSCVPVPLSLQTGSLYLSLYATGVRGASNVTVTIGGTPAQVSYAGPQPQYVGLDQVNVLVPQSLRGRGIVQVVLQAGGNTSNPATIAVE